MRLPLPLILAILLPLAACSWKSERDLLSGAGKDSSRQKVSPERMGQILEAEFGPAPQVLREGAGEKAHPGGLYTFKVEALERDGSVVQEEVAILLWPEVPVDSWSGAGLDAVARGPGWQVLQSCGRVSLPRPYLESMRVGEVRLFPRWGSVQVLPLNGRGARDIRQITRQPPGGPFIAENPDIRVTLEAFCVPKVVRVTTKGYSFPGGAYTLEYTAIRTCP